MLQIGGVGFDLKSIGVATVVPPDLGISFVCVQADGVRWRVLLFLFDVNN